MDKFEKVIHKEAKDVVKQLRKEGVMESDWTVEPVACTEVADPENAPRTRMLCEVRMHRKKPDTGQAQIRLEFPRTPEGVDDAKRMMLEQLRKHIHGDAGSANPPGGENENTNP